MEMWAIAYKYQVDVFFDFKENEDTITFSESCLLPTKELAEEFIEETLGDEYVPVSIKIEDYSNGIITTERGHVAEWEDY